MLWSQLLRRVFAVDVLRYLCGAEADRKLIGILSRAQTPDALATFLARPRRADGATATRQRAAAAATR